MVDLLPPIINYDNSRGGAQELLVTLPQARQRSLRL